MKDLKDLKMREIAAIKRQFKSSKECLDKINKLQAKIDELTAELNLQTNILNGGEAGIVALTGYRSVDLIKCEYIPILNEDGTPKMSEPNAAGKSYTLKKQVLTFVGPVEVTGADNDIDTHRIDDSALEETEQNPSDENAFNPTSVEAEELPFN